MPSLEQYLKGPHAEVQQEQLLLPAVRCHQGALRLRLGRLGGAEGGDWAGAQPDAAVHRPPVQGARGGARVSVRRRRGDGVGGGLERLDLRPWVGTGEGRAQVRLTSVGVRNKPIIRNTYTALRGCGSCTTHGGCTNYSGGGQSTARLYARGPPTKGLHGGVHSLGRLRREAVAALQGHDGDGMERSGGQPSPLHARRRPATVRAQHPCMHGPLLPSRTPCRGTK